MNPLVTALMLCMVLVLAFGAFAVAGFLAVISSGAYQGQIPLTHIWGWFAAEIALVVWWAARSK